MGYVDAYDVAIKCDNLLLAIAEHFCSNCDPPVPLYMVAVAIEAINEVHIGEGCAVINLPPGVTWREEITVRAQSAVDSLHLEAFVDYLRDHVEPVMQMQCINRPLSTHLSEKKVVQTERANENKVFLS